MAFKKGEILELDIIDMAYGGKGIAKIQTPEGELVAFVPNTIPGQKVQGRIFKKRKRFMECKLIDVLERSPEEADYDYQPISGAPFIQLPIEKQQFYKKRNTLDQYVRMGNVENIEAIFDEYISSPSVFHYRNKMEYAFSTIEYNLDQKDVIDDSFVLGSKRRGTWWMVENLAKDSGIFDKEFEDNVHQLTAYLKETGLPAWHPPKKVGFYRYLSIRKSFFDNTLLINLTTSATYLDDFDKNAFVAKVRALFGERIVGILHTVNDSLGERSNNDDNTYDLLFGENKVEEELLGLSFDVSMQSFFQTNPKSAERLYQKVIDYVCEDVTYKADDVVMDMFCGTGTIGQLISKKTGVKVIGVDIVKEAIENANINAKKNEVETASFYAADAGKFLIKYPQYVNTIKTVVLDPPRGGISTKSLVKILDLNAERIVYVSCNPSTQARDMQVLFEKGYKLIKISLVDQFPHTAHIESVALFLKE